MISVAKNDNVINKDATRSLNAGDTFGPNWWEV